MKVFLINLDRDADRLAAADRQLKGLGLSYERVSAVCAKDLPRGEKMRHVNRFRWWCATGRPPRDGEIGCALSHYSIYRRMIAEDIPLACVLEDDVVIDPRIHLVLPELERRLDPNLPQVALLSNHSDSIGQGPEDGDNGFHSLPDDNTFELRPSGWDMFTEGYVITRAGAKALLKANYPLRTPCDAWPRWVAHRDIRLYHAYPTTCSQNKQDFPSTTVGGGIWVDRMNPVRRLFYKAGRLVGRSIDKLLSRYYD